MTSSIRIQACLCAIGIALPSLMHAQTPLDSLIATDAAASDSGFPASIARAADELVLVYPGAPVIAGRTNAQRMLETQPRLRGLVVRWIPMHGEVSRDGSFGVTWGVTVMIDSASPGTVRFGKYLSAWRRDAAGWRLVAQAQPGLVASSWFVAAPGLAPGTVSIARGAAAFAAADSAFSAQAGREGAEAAFAAWIAPDGAMFSGSGEIVRGPEGAHRLLAGNGARWRWWPVAGFGAASGDLGITVGEAEIAAPGSPPSYTKYLTMWRRQPDGSVRFIADGGNGRPAPPR